MQTGKLFIHNNLASKVVWICSEENCPTERVPCPLMPSQHVSWAKWGWRRSFDRALAKMVRERDERLRMWRRVKAANGTELEQAMLSATST